MVRFPPPKSHDTFCPPPVLRIPKKEVALPGSPLVSCCTTDLVCPNGYHLFWVGQGKPININIWGGDGVRDKQEPSLGQTGPVPERTGPQFDVGTIVPQGPSEKCLCFVLIGFLSSKSGEVFIDYSYILVPIQK